MSIEYPPSAHRLSPSGPFLPPDFLGASVITNVYKCVFPKGILDAGPMHVPTSAPFRAVEFDIVLPTYVPNTDPPVPFDPDKLCYFICMRITARADERMGTPGPATINSAITVDAPNDATTPIENLYTDADNDPHWSNLAGGYSGASYVHVIPSEGVDEVDVVDHTPLAVFLPRTIPSWSLPATPWVAGETRHIYVELQGDGSEDGEVLLTSCEIQILELYGDATEIIGTSFRYAPT